jgi:hypothetical protein
MTPASAENPKCQSHVKQAFWAPPATLSLHRFQFPSAKVGRQVLATVHGSRSPLICHITAKEKTTGQVQISGLERIAGPSDASTDQHCFCVLSVSYAWRSAPSDRALHGRAFIQTVKPGRKPGDARSAAVAMKELKSKAQPMTSGQHMAPMASWPTIGARVSEVDKWVKGKTKCRSRGGSGIREFAQKAMLWSRL